MPANGRQVVEALLAEQGQLVTPAQAKAGGANSSVVPRLAAAGLLELVVPNVYGRVGVPLTWNRRLRAALLRAGLPAVASHRAAARLLGLATYEGAPAEITTPSKRHFEQAGVIVHQSRDLTYIPPVFVEGIPCTPPRRLAVDIGAVLGESAYTTVMRDLRREHGLTWKQLAAVLELHSSEGGTGAGRCVDTSSGTSASRASPTAHSSSCSSTTSSKLTCPGRCASTRSPDRTASSTGSTSPTPTSASTSRSTVPATDARGGRQGPTT